MNEFYAMTIFYLLFINSSLVAIFCSMNPPKWIRIVYILMILLCFYRYTELRQEDRIEQESK